ncbi:hypothetical protein CC80DRAFT_561583 [Byssothecium circinans]|uniref:Uncharacterized protein n=1 Tax=Byssothecium circinans TaxID=147558 RepID=A0A6A5U251_9PLEO|nr:hypothetical protein CC80DRAFT_561583 [Byssothecium circinans]
MPLKRKAAASPPSGAPSPKRKRGEPLSSLVPQGERNNAQKGIKNTSLLSMLCTDTRTGETKELHFKKLVHAQIDWNNTEHIMKINSWRNQLYGRAGMKAKTVIMWHADEEAYIELFFHLLILEAAQRGLMVPKAKEILEEYNDFFRGKVMKDANGMESDPRVDRKHNAFVSKLNRAVLELKPRLESMLLGKSGDFFSPQIDQEKLDVYKELLEAEPVNGDKKNMANVFTWEVGKTLPTSKPYVEEWQTAFTEMLARDPGSTLYDEKYAAPVIGAKEEPSNSLGVAGSSEKAITDGDTSSQDEGDSSFIDTSIFSVADGAGVDDDGDSDLSDVDDSVLEEHAAAHTKSDLAKKPAVDVPKNEAKFSSKNKVIEGTNQPSMINAGRESADTPIFKMSPKTSVENEVAEILFEMSTGAHAGADPVVTDTVTKSVVNTTTSNPGTSPTLRTP